MSLYSRSDLMAVAIPETSGGCGATHMRPVTRGAPVKTWKLDCSPCESYLRGDRKPKVIKVIPGDRDKGIPSRMEHIADADPHWSTTPEGIPPTPDEQNVNAIRAEKGKAQLEMLQALASLQAAGLKIPDEAHWLLEQNFDRRIIKGTVVCADGHQNAAGTKFCGECGMNMNANAMVEVGDPAGQEVDIAVTDGKIKADALPLRTLHVATLKKMAREKGLSDKGKKDEIIARLEAS